MLLIAICDDDKVICTQIEKILLDLGSMLPVRVQIEIFYSGEALMNELSAGSYFDLILLDIELPLINGVEIGKQIREHLNNEIVQIVYISGNDQYAMQLFDVRPLNFLIKPIDASKIEKVILKVADIIKKENLYFEYQVGRVNFKVPLKEIIYFMSDGKKVKIISKKGERVFYGKLSEVMSKIDSVDFILIHKSYLIHYLYVIEYHYEMVVMTNMDILPISQTNRSSIRRQLLLHRNKRK